MNFNWTYEERFYITSLLIVLEIYAGLTPKRKQYVDNIRKQLYTDNDNLDKTNKEMLDTCVELTRMGQVSRKLGACTPEKKQQIKEWANGVLAVDPDFEIDAMKQLLINMLLMPINQ